MSHLILNWQKIIWSIFFFFTSLWHQMATHLWLSSFSFQEILTSFSTFIRWTQSMIPVYLNNTYVFLYSLKENLTYKKKKTVLLRVCKKNLLIVKKRCQVCVLRSEHHQQWSKHSKILWYFYMSTILRVNVFTGFLNICCVCLLIFVHIWISKFESRVSLLSFSIFIWCRIELFYLPH